MYRCQRSSGCLPVFSCSSVVSSIPGITQYYTEMNPDTSGLERWQRFKWRRIGNPFTSSEGEVQQLKNFDDITVSAFPDLFHSQCLQISSLLSKDESRYIRLGTLAAVLDREESCNSLWILENPAVNLIVLFGYFRLGTLAAVLDVKESCNSLWILSISYKFHKK